MIGCTSNSFTDIFDNYLTPNSRTAWLMIFGFCIAIITVMYFIGYDDVEIGTGKFYVGLVIIGFMLIEGIGLGRGLKVWYQK